MQLHAGDVYKIQNPSAAGVGFMKPHPLYLQSNGCMQDAS